MNKITEARDWDKMWSYTDCVLQPKTYNSELARRPVEYAQKKLLRCQEQSGSLGCLASQHELQEVLPLDQFADDENTF